MKTSELRNKSDQELGGELEALYKEQFGLRMQQAVGQLSRPDRMKTVRRDIARIKTLMNERRTAG
ncbi:MULTISPECIES: 50S ribosomal protein L29 [Thioalkalivibrio]|uniref:Large ribosomal subunit protein uL29 n=1 Tax=Thioalkalivibrio halophilus TaxID=252474 RepID=A0A1V2ZVZ5_9GAMM|nr:MULTISPECIES: 50S ribosomal protein L29 [Thioalkalivibrio]OOC09307.1 50S ribosomal protein L29 [Thioalkalivibrio halophilus]PYG03012.1 LSU ribosomal protein L29P [Thioalkalivibrio sp. ALE21]